MPATFTPAPPPPAPTPVSSWHASASAASCCSARRTACGPRPGAAGGGAFATPLGDGRGRSRGSGRLAGAAAGRRQRLGARRGALAGGPAALPAVACSTTSRIVPLAVGDASPGEVAEVLDRLWGGPETLIVISSDLSHFHPYAQAREIDRARRPSAGSSQLDPTLDHEQACGATPINGLLLAARAAASRHRTARSCATPATPPATAPRRRLCAFALTNSNVPTTDRDLGALIARRAAPSPRASACPEARRPHDPARQAGATFVTLTQRRRAARLHRQPRGAPAARDRRAQERARRRLRDPRFPPLCRRRSFRGARAVEVSLLTPGAPWPSATRPTPSPGSRPASTASIFFNGRHRAPSCRRCGNSCPTRAVHGALKRKAGCRPTSGPERGSRATR
jgi:hypothetical protein